MKFTIENAIHIWYVTGYYNENEMLIDWYRFKGRPISEKGWQFRYAIVFTTLSPFFNNNIHPSIHPSIHLNFYALKPWNGGIAEIIRKQRGWYCVLPILFRERDRDHRHEQKNFLFFRYEKNFTRNFIPTFRSPDIHQVDIYFRRKQYYKFSRTW